MISTELLALRDRLEAARQRGLPKAVWDREMRVLTAIAEALRAEEATALERVPAPAAEEAASPLTHRLHALASVIATGIVPLIHRQHAAGLAAQLHALACQVGMTRLTGVRLRQTAEALRGRALAQPWQPPSAELVASIVARLREAADALADEAAPPAPSPPAAANVIDLASRRRPAVRPGPAGRGPDDGGRAA